MSNYRIKLSDGTTTINLFDGTDSIVREGGMDMPPPAVRAEYVSNPFADGARLASSHYENRQITLTLKIWGTSLSDLQTNIRAIHRLLNDAEKRYLLGHGAKVYLEYQWGDTNGQSVYYDILRGDLAMPRDYLSVTLNSYYIMNAVLTLTCSPFGRYTNQDIAQATLENALSPREHQQSSDPAIGAVSAVFGANWYGRTFTAGADFTCIAAAISGTRTGTLTDMTVSLYNTAAGLPNGAAIATCTFDVSGLDSTAVDYGWVIATFDTPVALTNGTVYALVVSVTGGDAGNKFNFAHQVVGGGGAGLASADSGATWAAEATKNQAYALFVASTKANYQDITTDATHGDAPAKLYMKIAQTGATGSEKIWIGKRSGTRQTDSNLWHDAEDYTSFTAIASGATLTVGGFRDLLTTASAGMFTRVAARDTAATIAANSEIGRFNFTFSSLPQGQYKVLARVRSNSTVGVLEYADMKFGMGWSYGGRTYAPSEASGEYYGNSADNTWEILDLGVLNLPPIAKSEIASNNTFTLRLYTYLTVQSEVNQWYYWDIDYIFLLPVDEGAVIINSVASTDALAIDGVTDPPGVFFLDGSGNINDYPDHVGAPFTLGRESTRIYILRDDVVAVTFALDTKYQPRFLLT